MASRRDQLNAYTFARKRSVAAFLQPNRGGTDETAPRPLRAVVPSTIVGVLIMAGFGAWGLIRPTAPANWDDGNKVIVGSDSTTRYVVLPDENSTDPNARMLHPVLNMASAKLLIGADGDFDIVQVRESELGSIKRGPTIGIPWAPDSLPTAEEAARAKTWAVCQQPPEDDLNAMPQQYTYVLSGTEDLAAINGPERQNRSFSLYVMDPDDQVYLISAEGMRYQLVADDQAELNALTASLFGPTAVPQRVSREWLNTLNAGPEIYFPTVEGAGEEVSSELELPAEYRTVGTVLYDSTASGGRQPYLVLRDRVALISPFMEALWLNSPQALEEAYQQTGNPVAYPVAAQIINQANAATAGQAEPFDVEQAWPREQINWANRSGPSVQNPTNTICSILDPNTSQPLPGADAAGQATDGSGSAAAQGAPEYRIGIWAGTDLPIPVEDEISRAYVSINTGLLYREVSGDAAQPDGQEAAAEGDTVSGNLYLITDTGLRYGVPVSGANQDPSAAPQDGEAQQEGAQDGAQEGAPTQEAGAKDRLGYTSIAEPVPVPQAWSEFLAKGPVLDPEAAARPQGS
ncbi:type VII secretion protein EccB [Allostreptomyces psammosilenae]|uniref:Type VII secretion protein EccB n=1 Tax=Allostreptomyces psammosilenae TaxID=1892865 RepID=A0A853A6I2_9ACTN|nr:type VII secretion protein EccB [Allostreptomyces psammosilenae]NYI08454.1 type VII secretion protein EccB [Allostreptomyces psammosilenae]